jgi:hypothetical protein
MYITMHFELFLRMCGYRDSSYLVPPLRYHGVVGWVGILDFLYVHLVVNDVFWSLPLRFLQEGRDLATYN